MLYYSYFFIHSLCVDLVLSVVCLNNTQLNEQHEVNKSIFLFKRSIILNKTLLFVQDLFHVFCVKSIKLPSFTS